MKRSIVILVAVVVIIFFNSCNSAQHEKTLTISGVVTNDLNYPLSGVKVSFGDYSFVTNETGSFLFDNISFDGESAVISFEKESYFPNSIYISELKDVSQIQIAMKPHAGSGSGFSTDIKLDISRGGEVKLKDGSFIYFPSGSVNSDQKFANVKFSLIPSNDFSFGNLIPGEDLKATDAKGNEAILYAYSLMFVEIFDDNQKCNLKNEVEFNIAIDKQDLANMPETMELYCYDEKTGLWKFETLAQKKANYYSAKINHFSSWALALPINDKAVVKGRVIDRSGRAIKGQRVKVFQTSAVSDSEGYYQAQVPAGQTFVVGMNYKGFEIRLDAGPLSNKEVAVYDISVPSMTMVSGVIKDCNGNNISGQANLTWGEPEFSNMYTKDGNFELSIPTALRKATLTISVGDSVVKKDIFNPNKETEIMAGEFTICVEKADKRETEDKKESEKDNGKDKEQKKQDPPKPKPVNVVGIYDFVSRSDGKQLVNYHRFTVNADGTYQEDYNPIGSTYVGGTKGTWKVSGKAITFTTVAGGVETYSVEGNLMIRKDDDGLIFNFRKR